MNVRLPLHCIKPRLLYEVPRSIYMGEVLKDSGEARALQNRDTRLRFLQMLRRGDERAQMGLGSQRPVRCRLNVAAWIRVKPCEAGMLSLVLVVREEEGGTAFLIDELKGAKEGSIMFSGEVTLASRNSPLSVHVGLSGASPDQIIHVEELFVQPAATQPALSGASRRQA